MLSKDEDGKIIETMECCAIFLYPLVGLIMRGEVSCGKKKIDLLRFPHIDDDNLSIFNSVNLKGGKINEEEKNCLHFGFYDNRGIFYYRDISRCCK